MTLHEDGMERVIPGMNWRSVGILALLLVVLATAGWEMNWRSKSYDPNYVNSYGLWAIQRREVSRQGDAIVLIGSSRIFFDVNLDVFEEGWGRRPIQLALEGTSPRTFLEDLANDEAFIGTVIVGLTPGLFFSGFALRGGALEYYRNESPSEWVSQQLSMLLEARFGFIESSNLPLFKLLERIPMENRKGVYPPHMDVHKLAVHDADRNTRMWRRVVEDPEYKKLVRDVWAFEMPEDPDKPREERPPIDPLPVFQEVKTNVERIRARGGDVVFVRCPSEGIFMEGEMKRFPRASYWDQLLVSVDAGGVHFEDNASLQGFELPEWSHIHPGEIDRFTEALVPLLRQALETRSAVKDAALGNNEPAVEEEVE